MVRTAEDIAASAHEHLDTVERFLGTPEGRERLRRLGKALGLTVPERDTYASDPKW